jgi:hypothetical protein
VRHPPGSAADTTLPSGEQPSTGGDVVSVMDAIAALRQTLTASIARGGEHSSADVDAYLDCEMAALSTEGY